MDNNNSRLQEPSTWVGLLTLVFGGWLGTSHPDLAAPTFWGAVVTVFSGVYNVFMREKK